MDKQASYDYLLSRLGHLAYRWRGSSSNPELQEQIVLQYHATVQALYELGWDDIIDIDSELPEPLMPERYLMRNPSFYNPHWNGCLKEIPIDEDAEEAPTTRVNWIRKLLHLYRR
jgi:hypothetical protein